MRAMGYALAITLVWGMVGASGHPAQADGAKVTTEPEGGQLSGRPPGERTDHNYQDFLPSALPTDVEGLVDDVKHAQVYRTATGPNWSCWTRVWFTPEGYLRVAFTDMSGGPAGITPSYAFEYAPADKLAEQGIKRCRRWCESRDGGQTWQPIREIDASDPLEPQPDFFLLLDDGATLGVGGVWNGWDFDKNTYTTIGHTMAWLSSDGGASLSKPVSLNDPEEMASFCCKPRQLRDGTIVVPAYGTFDKKAPNPTTDAWLWFSVDRGKNWSKPLLLASGIPTRTNDEPTVAELANGDLLVVLRHSNPKAEGAALYTNCGQMVVKRSESGWKPGEWQPTTMGFRGFPELLRTRNGVLICAGSGNQYNFSVDDGKTWSRTIGICDPTYNRHNHYPALTELPDGRILSVYHLGNHWPYPPPEDEWIHATSSRLKW